jgi:2-isopropylmalate synthase
VDAASLRTELEFLAQVVEAAIDAGATTINVPDTVGSTATQPRGNALSLRSLTAKANVADPCYSALNVSTGSTAAARHAGR